MPTAKFIGRVVPFGVLVNVRPFANYGAILAGAGDVVFRVHVRRNIVVVTCTGPNVDDIHFTEMHAHAVVVARNVVDIFAFKSGVGLTVVFEKYKSTSKLRLDIRLHDPTLSPIVDSFDLSKDWLAIGELMAREHLLRSAIHDLADCLNHPNDIAINCGRATEAVRRMISPSDSDPKKAWARMRLALNIDRTYLEFLTKHSTDPRHGNRVQIDGATNQELCIRAWNVMNRYLAFRLGGSRNLTGPQYPHLCGGGA